jgi:hypothetical protein
MASPGRKTLPAGAVVCHPSEQKSLAGDPDSVGGPEFGKRTCKPNSVVCGHSSRRRVAADAHQRPTRRFRQVLKAPLRRRPVAGNPAKAAWAHRADAQQRRALRRVLPSLFGLAPCGVYPAPAFTGRAVRSCRTISPLPRRWSFRNGERTRQAGPTRVLRFQGGPRP